MTHTAVMYIAQVAAAALGPFAAAGLAVVVLSRRRRRRDPPPAGDAELLAVASATHEDQERVASTGELAAVPDQLEALRRRRR